MTIKTKYNIGDEVWSICECKAYKFTIKKIEMKILPSVTVVKYYLKYIDVQSTTFGDIIMDTDVPEPYLEQHLFSTKEELLKSLQDENN